MPGSAAAVQEPWPNHANELLGQCPPETVARWAPVMQPVVLAAGTPLYGAQSRIVQVFFPVSAVVAVEHRRADGQGQTVALLGADQLAGASVLLGPDSGPERAVVVVGGTALRLDAIALRGESQRDAALAALLARYLQAFITQVAQTAFCNRHHGLRAHLALRLLQLIGRADHAELALPQAALGELIGARRERVNQLLGELHADAAVEPRRGRLRIQRAGLLRHVCDCHGVLETARRHVLGPGR